MRNAKSKILDVALLRLRFRSIATTKSDPNLSAIFPSYLRTGPNHDIFSYELQMGSLFFVSLTIIHR